MLLVLSLGRGPVRKRIRVAAVGIAGVGAEVPVRPDTRIDRLAREFLAAVPPGDRFYYRRFKEWAEWNGVFGSEVREVWRTVMDLTREELNAGVDTITGYVPDE